MLIPDRRRRVLEHVRRHGSATVDDLAELLDVSGSTIRRDMARLERDGVLVRTHGGAVVSTSAARSERPAEPSGTDEAKERIGRRAAELVADGSTIMVLAGSTTSAMIPALYDRDLTVVTNGLDIAHGLRHAPNISLVVLGGYLHREQMTLLGPMSSAAMSSLHVDAMLAGAWGVDADTGVTGTKIIQAGNHEVMLRHTEKLIVLADATKLGRRGPTLLAGMEQLDTLVTDAAGSAEIDRILNCGVRVEVA